MASSLPSLSSPFSLLAITTVLAILSPSLSSLAAAIPQNPRPFKKIYAFGDSYTDTGNTHSETAPIGFSHVSSPPYGRTFFHRPTNRYSDGRILLDFAAQSLSLPFLPPFLDSQADTSAGVNFAVAGATAIRHGFFVKNKLMLGWFNKTLKAQGCEGETSTEQCRKAIADALFWVGEIGANDYGCAIGSSVQASTIQRAAIKSVTGFLRALLTKGAKYVVVQGLFSTGCLPLSLQIYSQESDRDDLGCVASENRRSYAFNADLQSTLQDLRTEFPDAVIIYADSWNAHRHIIKNAKRYGFKDTFSACCGTKGEPYNFYLFSGCGSPTSTTCPDPEQYVIWDGPHLTEAMNRVLAELFLNGTFSSPPFEYMLSRKSKAGTS
ncbi:Sinapine esterase [Bertholletia excelsa]